MIWLKYDITPVPKPRQTQRDKWKRRDVVMRYRAFADETASVDVLALAPPDETAGRQEAVAQ